MFILRTSKSSIFLLGVIFVILSCARARHESKPYSVLTVEKHVSLPLSSTPERIIQIAQNALGTRYRFGGNSTKSTDCSGFVQRVFKKEGIQLPRSSFNQAQYGLFIPNRKKLKPADLVFFETYRNGPSHVGIYLGKARFIHASTAQNKVVISSLNSAYYEKRFLGGKRILSP